MTFRTARTEPDTVDVAQAAAIAADDPWRAPPGSVAALLDAHRREGWLTGVLGGAWGGIVDDPHAAD